MSNSLFRKKSLTTILRDAQDGLNDGHGGMNKVLGVKDLTAMGIAAVIGAGIFSTIGQASYDGGPGVTFLFIITAITCGFCALCYAEFASRIPVSGSAYTYSYVTFGELTAWVIGWALILEYAIGNIAVSISWSGYFNNLLEGIGLHFPEWLVNNYDSATEQQLASAPHLFGIPVILNLPAFLIVVIVTYLAYLGISESKKSANFMVGLKIAVILMVIVVGAFYVNTGNWHPFMPNGFSGVLKGVSAVFFAYIGFDAVSTTAEECANPQRDLPKGMMYSLIICTILYIAIALVLTGMVSYSQLKVTDPLAFVFTAVKLNWVSYLISVSAVVATTSVLLVFQIGQPRIWMSMSRDGLLPKPFSRIHPKFRTPSFATIITGIIVGVPALFLNLTIVTDLTSIGTLFAFILVCGGVLLLPKEDPDTVGKNFRVPYVNSRYIIPILVIGCAFFFRGVLASRLSFQGGFEVWKHNIPFFFFVVATLLMAVGCALRNLSLIPVLGLLSCFYLMTEIGIKNWIVFGIWLVIGLVIYFSYSYRHSKLGKDSDIPKVNLA
ncbi:amino acid/polyamine/organocation transporter, APC superfamily [Chitinophaga costaii]|uniref:Amino acid/polyamine/organocation transporter, APC superfamily n=1 Tax=Chitinophaga costaii TaxID=1335309 RepID=A0A1C4G488_9BACT|nr:amino acid permease [Chitinophaga costaii]PUZ20975.1 amino acid permease [Chitinophaga costaii]SCC62685.1 amino acid/polyamine/organocation transporter, APC superfamily [Chitinophaga costaii]